jgi:hypothetical protein
VLCGYIDLDLTHGLVNSFLCENRPCFLALEDLGHRDEVEWPYRRVILDISQAEECRTATGARYRNFDCPDPFKMHTSSNPTARTILALTEV